jgi:hypothetical protein
MKNFQIGDIVRYEDWMIMDNTKVIVYGIVISVNKNAFGPYLEVQRFCDNEIDSYYADKYEKISE